MERNRCIVEWRKCYKSSVYFINTYGRIYDPQSREWIPFLLWPQQKEALKLFHERQFVVVLKARQLGMTWLALGYALWLMLFRAIATVMLFSRRDDEAIYLLSEERLRGMYYGLPEWMRAEAVAMDNAHQLKLSNGSIAYAFPTTAGDSYSASAVIIDEADLMPDLNRIMRAAKPTIDAGGKLIIISRSNKSVPLSEFKRIYRAAKEGRNDWAHIFLPWWVRPSRDLAWYETQKRDILERTGGLDDLYEQYPETDIQALAAASLNKRIPAEWIEACYAEMAPAPLDQLPVDAPKIPGMRVYVLPEKYRQYVGGLDCAEGLPSSDDSATTFVDALSGEEVCNLVGKYPPHLQAVYSAQIADWYNGAGLLVERQNHGHAAIGWLNENGYAGRVLNGHDGRPGWLSSTLGKVLMYDTAAEMFQEGETVIHDFATLTQLASIEKSTLRAPEGEMDDRADSYAFALCGRRLVLQQETAVGFRQGRVRW